MLLHINFELLNEDKFDQLIIYIDFAKNSCSNEIKIHVLNQISLKHNLKSILKSKVFNHEPK